MLRCHSSPALNYLCAADILVFAITFWLYKHLNQMAVSLSFFYSNVILDADDPSLHMFSVTGKKWLLQQLQELF